MKQVHKRLQQHVCNIQFQFCSDQECDLFVQFFTYLCVFAIFSIIIIYIDLMRKRCQLINVDVDVDIILVC